MVVLGGVAVSDERGTLVNYKHHCASLSKFYTPNTIQHVCFNPTPQTLIAQPSTRNTKPETLNVDPKTVNRNPNPEILAQVFMMKDKTTKA